MFNLKKSEIFKAVIWERIFNRRIAGFFRKFFFWFFLLFFVVFLCGFFGNGFPSYIISLILKLDIIFLALCLILLQEELFFSVKLKNPRLKIKIEDVILNPQQYNLADFLAFDVAKAASRAKGNLTRFFYHILSDNKKLNFVFSRALLDRREIKKILNEYLKKASSEEDDFSDVIAESLKTAQKKNHGRIEMGDIITALAKLNPIFKELLISINLKAEDIENLTWWLEDLEKNIKERKNFWEWKNLIKKGSLAKAWTAGYTLTLDKFSIDLTEMMEGRGFPQTIGHETEIKAMERILSRRETNNVLLVGESGSGRKSMIYELAKRSVLGESLPEVNFKRVVQLDIQSLLALTQSSEEAEKVLDRVFQETVSSGNIILVIDEFHNFVKEVSKPGTIDISGVISPYLPLPQFQIIAITTFEGLHKNIEQNSSVLSLFEKVEVSEISERETLMLLEDLTLKLEYKYRKFISYPALRDTINYCSKYMPDTTFPEKAMELLEEAMVYLVQTRDKILLPKHVAHIVSEKTQIPVGEIETKEKEILLNLENLIHERIINQEEAVREVSAALRRARSEVTVRKGPMGCFLFLGPTGVGKTETSKALAGIYFGSEERMIRLDMSEFQQIQDIPRLIGSAGEEGLLTTQAREKPFSLILLDELEKAHPNILNLFLQVLDEGILTDGLGRKVDFKNSIIIATSNAGYQIILDSIKQNTDWTQVKEKIFNFLFTEGVFRPEFLNRFDAVVIFKPLNKENLLSIAGLLLQKLKKNLKEKGIEFIITDPLKEKIAELGFDPIFGARQMRRVIQDKVENVLASAILSGELKRGSRVEIDAQTFQLLITKQ